MTVNRLPRLEPVEVGTQPENILYLEKDGHRYLFRYDDASYPQLIRTLGVFAARADLRFDWMDCASLTQVAIRLKAAVDALPEDEHC